MVLNGVLVMFYLSLSVLACAWIVARGVLMHRSGELYGSIVIGHFAITHLSGALLFLAWNKGTFWHRADLFFRSALPIHLAAWAFLATGYPGVLSATDVFVRDGVLHNATDFSAFCVSLCLSSIYVFAGLVFPRKVPSPVRQ